jgi:hypothetical protein
MKRFPPAFDEKEAAILLAMYEVEDGTYTSYTLARELNPTVEMGTASALTAFTETRDATERLVVRSLVRGERLRGANGVYFDKLKLTTKGQQSAIQQKTTVEATKKAITEAMKHADSVTEEMKKWEKDDKK